MSDRRDQSNRHPHEGNRNAFAPFFLDHMARREPVAAAPEARSEGPFRVVKLYGDGPPLWACYAAGERQPRSSVEAPDLAYLLAAGMEIAERPLRFGFEEADARGGRRAFHLLHDRQAIGGRRGTGGGKLLSYRHRSDPRCGHGLATRSKTIGPSVSPRLPGLHRTPALQNRNPFL